jgi:hypothetical protein
MAHLTSVELAAKGRRVRKLDVSFHFRCEVRDILDEGVDVVLHDLTGRSRDLLAKLQPNNFTKAQLDSMMPGDTFEWRLGQAMLNTGSTCHYSETIFP